jgi:hypothetical protein
MPLLYTNNQNFKNNFKFHMPCYFIYIFTHPHTPRTVGLQLSTKQIFVKCTASVVLSNLTTLSVVYFTLLVSLSSLLQQQGDYGHAIAQAVSHQFLTRAAWVQAQVMSCMIFGGQHDTGAGFPQMLWFPLPIPNCSTFINHPITDTI